MPDIFSFTIILDDLVFPDGKTCMGLLGGGGPQTAFGMRLWSDSVGIIAGVGPDCPKEFYQWLETSRIDSSGIRVGSEPTPRAWQILESDGRRTQVWRTPFSQVQSYLERSLDTLPDAYKKAAGVHLGVHPDGLPAAASFLKELHDSGMTVSIEPFNVATQTVPKAVLQELSAWVQILSMNDREAASVLGPGQPETWLQSGIDAGFQVMVIRMAEKGSIIASAGHPAPVHVPAVPVTVIDPTGAGNAYCGGFLAGWVQSHHLAQAGAYGSVAASFLLEQIGVPTVSTEIRHEAAARYRQDLGIEFSSQQNR